MTVDEVKTLLRISATDKTKDDYLGAILPLVEDHVKAYCNQTFDEDADGNVVYPGGVKIAIAKWCQAFMKDSGVQSESLARHSVTYSGAGMPSEVKAILSNYRRPHFV